MSASDAVPTSLSSLVSISKSQFRLVDAEGAALLPDGAKGPANQFGDFGVREPAQKKEFIFCPWPGFAFRGHDAHR